MIAYRIVTLALLAWLAVGAAWAVEDLTFIHVTDEHAPHAAAQTRETIAALPVGHEIALAPYGVTATAPSFVLSTGDLNEFGGGSGWWAQYLGLWTGIDLPLYLQLGNHDNTWRCGRPRLRERHRSAFYAFEQGGVKFIGWDTATPQDPRPSIAEEGVRWLAAEFERTPPEQPVMVFLHHALDGREFAGAWDRARLLDLLRTRNVVVVLVGHGHNARAWQVEGLDTVMGGSTWGDQRGFGIVSIRDNVLRVCHQYASGEMVALLERPLPERSPFLQMTVEPQAPVFEAGQALRWRVSCAPADGALASQWTLDGDASDALAREGEAWLVELPADAVEPGAHVLRVELTDPEGRVTSRTDEFFVNGGDFDVAWRARLGGSSQSTPAVSDGRVYVGDNCGALTALDAADGRVLREFRTGGEVRSAPLVDQARGTVYFGSADGWLCALSRDGADRWRFDAGSAIYGSPALVGERVVFGTAAGEVIALDAATGALAWRSDAPEYAIEVAPCGGAEGVYVGAWDHYAYALELADGALRWRHPSAGSDREGFVAWYYSPADCAPAFAGGNVFFADRAYRLTVFDAATGERLLDEEKAAAVAGSADGRFVYVRHSDGRVSKRSADGSVVWLAEVPTGAVATPPVASGGIVWVISDRGMLSALDDATGTLLGQGRVTRDLFAFAAPAFDGRRVYIADMAGRLTAFTPAFLGPR